MFPTHPAILHTFLGSKMDLFVCVEVLQPSQPNGVMSSAVSLPNHTFTGLVEEKFKVKSKEHGYLE